MRSTKRPRRSKHSSCSCVRLLRVCPMVPKSIRLMHMHSMYCFPSSLDRLIHFQAFTRAVRMHDTTEPIAVTCTTFIMVPFHLDPDLPCARMSLLSDSRSYVNKSSLSSNIESSTAPRNLLPSRYGRGRRLNKYSERVAMDKYLRGFL